MNKQLSFSSPIDELLDRLYAQSASQNEAMEWYFTARAQEGALDWKTMDAHTTQFLSDKLVALDRNKAEFCYQGSRSLRSRRIVEAGSSFHVSRLALASAVCDNVGA